MSLYGRKLLWAASKQKIGPEKSSGALISLFNKNDTPTFEVSYVYVITIPKDGLKGPFLHSLRTTICTPIFGSLDIIYFDKPTNSYNKLSISSENPIQTVIPSGTTFCLIGTSELPAIIVNLCDFPWSPDNNECSIPNFECEYISNLIK